MHGAPGAFPGSIQKDIAQAHGAPGAFPGSIRKDIAQAHGAPVVLLKSTLPSTKLWFLRLLLGAGPAHLSHAKGLTVTCVAGPAARGGELLASTAARADSPACGCSAPWPMRSRRFNTVGVAMPAPAQAPHWTAVQGRPAVHMAAKQLGNPSSRESSQYLESFYLMSKVTMASSHNCRLNLINIKMRLGVSTG